MPPIAFTLLLVCGFAIQAGADTVNTPLTGVNGANTDGIYVDPYYGTVNGAPTALYCNDFTHESYLGDTFFGNTTEYDGSAICAGYKIPDDTSCGFPGAGAHGVSYATASIRCSTPTG